MKVLSKILKKPEPGRTVLLLLVIIAGSAFINLQKPTLYIIGDSTVRNTQAPMCGWGSVIDSFFDTSRIKVENHAMAGRSTRTFIKEGRWAKVDSLLKPGDFVMMQFGHNDGSIPDITHEGYRGTLKGTGKETKELIWPGGKKETVLTYGAYIRKFIRDAKAKGAVPVVLSMIPRNMWRDGKVLRADNDFGLWAQEVAKEEGAFFVDLNKITACKYDKMGPDEVKKLFPGDHTHTNKAGALINAASITEGLKALADCPLSQYLIK